MGRLVSAIIGTGSMGSTLNEDTMATTVTMDPMDKGLGSPCPTSTSLSEASKWYRREGVNIPRNESLSCLRRDLAPFGKKGVD